MLELPGQHEVNNPSLQFACDLPCSHLGQSVDPTKRSINLALSHRGLSALAAIGVKDTVLKECIRMPCRAIHDLEGRITTQSYGVGDQAIWSASRSLLNRVVLERCEEPGTGIRIFFDHGLRSVDVDGTAVFEDAVTKTTRTVRAALVIGADGAYSAVRTSMLRISRMSFSREYIKHGYKELNMPPITPGSFPMPTPNALHIWPRHEFMMIALPNPDCTFTCTLFLPWGILEHLDATPSAVRPFFERHFPDALKHIPELEAQFAANPSSALVMTKADPWNVGDKALLIGDAAHSVVPFYGQGANAAFEDCLVFAETLDAVGGDLSKAVTTFAAARKPAGDALAKLSLDNYIEMRHKTASAAFLLRKRLEALLHTLMPNTWIPQYSMVSFTRIPYDEVLVRAARQERILDWATAGAVAGAAMGLGYWAVKSGAAARAGAAAVDLLRKWRK
jgi:kynurenine 3-monooxygenase